MWWVGRLVPSQTLTVFNAAVISAEQADNIERPVGSRGTNCGVVAANNVRPPYQKQAVSEKDAACFHVPPCLLSRWVGINPCRLTSRKTSPGRGAAGIRGVWRKPNLPPV